MAAGVRAWCIVLDTCPMLRRIIDIVKVQVNPKRRNVKKAPASRRRFAKKYSGTLKQIVDKILVGRSQIMDDMASAKG